MIATNIGRRRLTETLLRGMVLACFVVGIAQAEDWPGLEGGGPRHNASAVDVPPHRLQVLWQRSFLGKRFGNWDQEPVDQMQFPGARGSRNLCLVAGKLTLVAADGAGTRDDWYLCVLDAADGRTLNCVHIVGNVGNNRVYNWPHNAMSGANDGVTGFMTTDLIAADGRLYALITRSDRLWMRDPRWTEQLVAALAPTADALGHSPDVSARDTHRFVPCDGAPTDRQP